MLQNNPENSFETVCDFTYLNEMMCGENKMIMEMMDIILKQIPEDLAILNEAVKKADYLTIKKSSHKLKSPVSVMGISSLKQVLFEMETLGAEANDIDKIISLSIQANEIFNKALGEVEIEKNKLV